MSKLSAGIVTIVLDGEEIDLKCSPRATMRICDLDGGLTATLANVQKLNMRTYVQVIKFGAHADDDLSRRLEEMVFKTGMLKLMSPVVRYLMLLSNGGQADGEVEADGGNGPAAGAA